MDRRALGRATLARQLLLERASGLSVVDAVERVGGLQAQDPSPPFLALWSRLEGFAREDLHAAFHDRSVVRATLMRVTLFVVSADDYRHLRPTLHESLAAGGTIQAGIDLERLRAVAHDLLVDGPMTFKELRPKLAAAFPDADERLLGYAVRRHLPLIIVPTDKPWAFSAGGEFGHAADWLDKPLRKRPAPKDLVRRYLGAYGPATVRDAQNWSGMRGLAPTFDALEDELVTFEGEDGQRLYDLPDAPRPDPEVAAPPRLLPEFDSVLLAHEDRSRIVSDEHRPVLMSKNLRLSATMLVDGRVAGTWKITRKGKKASLTMTPFGRILKRDMKALEHEAEQALAFTDPDATHDIIRP